MLWPFPKNKVITSSFDEPRPLSDPGKHIHGAIDIKGDIGDRIISPEPGFLSYYFGIRHDKTSTWPPDKMGVWPFRNYFYDVWGAVIVLRGKSGLTHLFAHSYMNQLFNDFFAKRHWGYVEEQEDKRFPIFSFIMGEVQVRQGELIGKIGNAGYSTGPHCHYEIHNHDEWTRWEYRQNPEKIKWENL